MPRITCVRSAGALPLATGEHVDEAAQCCAVSSGYPLCRAVPESEVLHVRGGGVVTFGPTVRRHAGHGSSSHPGVRVHAGYFAPDMGGVGRKMNEAYYSRAGHFGSGARATGVVRGARDCTARLSWWMCRLRR